MKKVLAVFTIILVILSAASTLAALGAPFGMVDFEGLTPGISMNDGELKHDVLTLRQDWTPSRGLPGSKDNAIFTDMGGNIAVRIKDDEFIVSDYDMDSYNGVVFVDLMCKKLGDFCGIMLDIPTDKGGLESGTSSLFVDENGNILDNCYGFTIMDRQTVRAFVTGSGQYVYADYELGFDAGESFHTYEIYRDCEESKSYLVIDGYIYAIFDFSTLKDMAIRNSDGTDVGLKLKDVWKCGDICFSVVGKNVDIYMDNIGYDKYERLPVKKAAKTPKSIGPDELLRTAAEETPAPDESEPTAEPSPADGQNEPDGSESKSNAAVTVTAAAVSLAVGFGLGMLVMFVIIKKKRNS